MLCQLLDLENITLISKNELFFVVCCFPMLEKGQMSCYKEYEGPVQLTPFNYCLEKKEMMPLISPGLSQKAQNFLISCFLTVAICMIASRVSCNLYIPSSYVFIENSLFSVAIKNIWKIQVKVNFFLYWTWTFASCHYSLNKQYNKNYIVYMQAIQRYFNIQNGVQKLSTNSLLLNINDLSIYIFGIYRVSGNLSLTNTQRQQYLQRTVFF